MNNLSRCATFLASLLIVLGSSIPALAQTPPPAPVLVAPSGGAAIVQPITLDWNAVTDPDGPIGSYTWQVSTSSTFSTIVVAGFTNNLSDAIPTATQDKVSGLPNGTYFWRVKATQTIGGATGFIDSPWSAARTFTVSGLGPAPGAPSFSKPATGASFHVAEFFTIQWSAVPGAQYYLLEADDDPAFSYPLTLTTTALTFGTDAEAGWGNAIPNIYYRVRAVSADNVRGLPSSTLNIHVTNAAPVPPAPTLLAPAIGATVSLPFTFDWTDTANPQVLGYDVDVDTDPNFRGSFGVLLLQGVSRSDYLVASDLPPGSYFWRVRARHGAAFGPWSAGRAIKVVAAPATPAGLDLFAIIASPGNAFGGNSTQARVLLNQPAPAGGVSVKLASDLPQAQVPASIIVAAGSTDGTVSITSGPVPGNGIVGVIRAAYGGAWQQNSLGVLPILYGTSLGNESVIGGTSFSGTVILQSAAPPGGTTVRLISSDTSLARTPATVFIPQGGTDATFAVTTTPVSVPTRVVFETGTDDDGYRAPQAAILLTPPGSPTPAPSLSSITLNQASVLGGGSATGTVTLTSPAPAGGAVVSLNGSMEGEVITPPNVTVPAGSLSATFTMTAPQVVAPHWVLVQGRYGTDGGTQAKVLEIDPSPPGASALLAFGVTPSDVVGGNPVRATAALVMPAPSSGGSVNLTSHNPGVLQVPAAVAIAGGNSTNTVPLTTSSVPVLTTVQVDASAGGVTKSWFVNVAPNPNAPPLLQSLTLSPASVAGGTSATGTIVLSAPAPSGGVTVTLATSNPSVAKPPPIVSVAAGQTTANFTVTTFAVSANASVSISAFFDTTLTASLTVTKGTTPPPVATLSTVSVSPSTVVGGNTSQGTVTLTSAAPSGGAVVTLSSSNTAAATVPASVTIASGATSASFTLASKTVTASTAVTLTATYSAVSRNATLTVNPAGSGSLAAPSLVAPADNARFSPGQNIAFDWSDVAGAASYSIQIDDQDTFPSPLIVGQSVTASQFSSSTLPTKKMWWRVRAVDASGNPGSWSSVRRLEVKN